MMPERCALSERSVNCARLALTPPHSAALLEPNSDESEQEEQLPPRRQTVERIDRDTAKKTQPYPDDCQQRVVAKYAGAPDSVDDGDRGNLEQHESRGGNPERHSPVLRIDKRGNASRGGDDEHNEAALDPHVAFYRSLLEHA